MKLKRKKSKLSVILHTLTTLALNSKNARLIDRAYIEGKLEIRDELVNNIDPPSDLVADLISKVEELAEADAAYMEEKESKTAASVYTIDTPTSWISDLSQTAAELADSDAAYLQEKVAEVENVKSELKISDPTEGMNDKELKRYREKVLYDAKKIERNALAAARGRRLRRTGGSRLRPAGRAGDDRRLRRGTGRGTAVACSGSARPAGSRASRRDVT